MTTFRTPPGRAGRLRLRHSLAVAERGAELLERKHRILRAEHQRLLRAEEAAASAWHERLREAEGWLLRGLLLSGEAALAAAVVGVAPADATAHRTTSVGVRYPTDVTCATPDRSPAVAAPANTALVRAETAYREAVRAAAEHAATAAAVRIIGAEVLSTGQRVRALRRHWIPRLSEALAHTELTLEQNDFEDAVRRHWASRDRQAGRPPGTR
ncbi:V-type ATP synthase subunit D [Kitasatospora griseola]|uniref:V-type ATP synthase subunit D n=1 Tax=Kitasatospora griseola TaxID=2064 RepID=UPI0009F85586|nr:V-type ATP synthase subunit D [Kitasatospora griseola]